MKKSKIIGVVSDCLNKLYDEHHDILENDVQEETINYRLTKYLSAHFEHGDIKVDPEYNRHGEEKKKYGKDGKYAKVDIVVHQRMTDHNNLIAFECKKGNHSRQDKIKIDALLREYGYQYGILIEYKKHRFTLCQLVADEIQTETIEL